MGLVPLAHNAGTGWVAARQVLMYGRTGAYMCMDGCLYMHGRMLIYAWTDAYICMDGSLYMHGRVLIYMYGRVLILHGRVLGRNLPGECTLPFNIGVRPICQHNFGNNRMLKEPRIMLE